jgi:CHRD domain
LQGLLRQNLASRLLVRTILIAAVIVSCGAMPARATLWTFNNTLDGSQETPPNSSPGTGSLTATLDDVTGQMDVSGSYQNLIGVTGDSHVHCCAPPGQPALILFYLTNNPPGTQSGTFTGSAVLSADYVQNVLSGLSYVNVHTSEVPGGEIRGQIMNPVSTLPGDFNADGRVDARDYVIWRKGNGQIYGDQDYGAWRAHFGQTTGGGNSIATAAVPEPTCVVLVLSALGLLAGRCGRR